MNKLKYIFFMRFPALKKGIIVQIVLIATAVTYYIPVFHATTSISSGNFVSSSFGTSFFPDSFTQFWMVLLNKMGSSLYYSYLSFAIVSLYLSMLGVYIFLTNLVFLVLGTKEIKVEPKNSEFIILVSAITFSILISTNPFFANNYALGVGIFPFLTISLGLASIAVRFKITDKKFLSLMFLISFLLIMGYNGYILLPVYFALIFILIIIPASYNVVSIYRPISLLVFSETIFFAFSGIFGFITESLSGSLGQLFPYFRPLNLDHEYALLSNSDIFKALSGLSFNVGFNQAQITLLETFIIIIFAISMLLTLISYIFSGRRKPFFFLFELIIIIILSLPYKDNIPIIGSIPIYLISTHTFTYNHLGEILSIFDSNRFLLFPYWFLLPTVSAMSIITTLLDLQTDSINSFWNSKNLRNRYKRVVYLAFLFLIVTIIMVASYSTINGPYNYINFDKSSPTYAYSTQNNASYNRMLIYQNENIFYPGNLYPSQMEMQADIPDKPMYVNFLNMESSPLATVALNSLPPASFVYKNGTENFINGMPLSNNYNYVSNENENLTVGFPVFVIGSQYTFDQYLFSNYYLRANTTHFESYKNVTDNYGRFVYYSIPSSYLSFLNTTGGMIEINTNINVKSPIQNGTAYSFGLSNSSEYWPSGVNELGFLISVFNQSSSPVWLGSGNPIVGDFNYTEYISVDNAFSYNLGNYIPFQGNSTGNVSIVFYNSGVRGVYGFIDYEGNWYQSVTNYSLSQVKYFYSQAYLDSQSGISYNVTISEMKANPLYRNLVPVYYDSPFSSDESLISSINHSDLIVECSNNPLSNLVGSLLEFSRNSTVVSPAAYSVNDVLQGWYQVFSDGAAQSSYQGEYIPSVIDPPVFSYGAYSGFAQSIVENSTFSIPISGYHFGESRLELNLLFSPVGGSLIVTAGGKNYDINSFANSSYYGWLGLNVSGKINKLTIEDKTGVQSINQIILSNLTTYKYFYNVSVNLLNKNNFTSLSGLPTFKVLSSDYLTSPVRYNALINLAKYSKVNVIVEFSNPLYSGLTSYSTNSSLYMTSSWASFPAILVYNVTGKQIEITYTESLSAYYSGYLPFLELQGVWIPFLIDYIISRRIRRRRRSDEK